MSLSLRRIATIVGRNPCSARVPLDPLFAFCLQPIQAMKRPVRGPAADGGVRPTWARNPRNVNSIGIYPTRCFSTAPQGSPTCHKSGAKAPRRMNSAPQTLPRTRDDEHGVERLREVEAEWESAACREH